MDEKNKNFLGRKLNAIWQEMRKLPEAVEQAASTLLRSSEKIDKQTDELAGIAKNFALIMEQSEKGKVISGTVSVDNLYEEVERALKANPSEPFTLDYSELEKLFDKNTPKDSIKLENVQELAQELKKILPTAAKDFGKVSEKMEVFGKTLVKIEGNKPNNPVFVQLTDGKNIVDLKDILNVKVSTSGGGGGGSIATETDGSGSVTIKTYDLKNISPVDDPEILTYKYYGYCKRGGTDWRIMRKTLATNVFEYATGTSGYATAWTNKSSGSYS